MFICPKLADVVSKVKVKMLLLGFQGETSHLTYFTPCVGCKERDWSAKKDGAIMTDFSTIYKLSIIAFIGFIQGKLNNVISADLLS